METRTIATRIRRIPESFRCQPFDAPPTNLHIGIYDQTSIEEHWAMLIRKERHMSRMHGKGTVLTWVLGITSCIRWRKNGVLGEFDWIWDFGILTILQMRFPWHTALT